MNALAFFAGAHPTRAEPPTSFRLSAFADDLYNPDGQQVLEVIGDSINSTGNINRMQAGYRDQFEMPFNGWVVHADNGNSDIGYTNGQSFPAASVVRQPENFPFCGPSAFSPLRYRDTIWDAPPGVGSLLTLSAVNVSNLGNMRLGNPFDGRYTLSARLIAFDGPCQYPGFTVQGVRNDVINSETVYRGPEIPTNEIVFVDCTISGGPGLPTLRVASDTLTAVPVERRNGVITMGTRFRAEGIAGVQMQFISHGGWRTIDHLAPAKFSNEAIAQLYRATDPPTHVILWLGQNISQEEANGFAVGDRSPYRNNLRAIMDRHNTVISSLGALAPRWLLVSQYKTGYDESFHQQVAQAQFDLALADLSVSTLNLYRLAGGESFNKAAYLSDGVHPNAAGVQHLAMLMNSAMLNPDPCPTDVNGDGFVNGDDFDVFTALFEAGDHQADFNGDGFTNGDDFDAFATAFIAGC